jgi:hypothetical protein
MPSADSATVRAPPLVYASTMPLGSEVRQVSGQQETAHCTASCHRLGAVQLENYSQGATSSIRPRVPTAALLRQSMPSRTPTTLSASKAETRNVRQVHGPGILERGGRLLAAAYGERRRRRRQRREQRRNRHLSRRRPVAGDHSGCRATQAARGEDAFGGFRIQEIGAGRGRSTRGRKRSTRRSRSAPPFMPVSAASWSFGPSTRAKRS